MTEPTQTELRTWARAQGITVKDRGSLPLAVRQAYLEAHAAPGAAETESISLQSEPQQEVSADDSVLGIDSADASGRASGHDEPTSSGSTGVASADLAPSVDLAGDLHDFLVAVDAEIDAVSSLSDRIDARVTELNQLRAEQATRLLALDDLRESVKESSLSAFLTKVIRPRATRVVELIPERLQ